MKSYVKVRSELTLHQGLLYRKLRLKDKDEDTYQFVVPFEFRKLALSLTHDSFGHLGIDRSTVLMIDRFFWPKMSEEIRTYIQNCERCIRYKQQPHQAELVPLNASYPLQTIHMDFLQIGSKKEKDVNVLVITDHFTRYAQAFVTNSQRTNTVIEVFIDQYVVHYGWPEKILTDQGTSFEAKLFQDLCDEAKIRKMRTTPYHPMGNGQPERFNRTLLTIIGCLPAVEKAKWQSWVNHLTHAYNCTKSQVMGFSPYFLMFGREPRIPVDEAFEVTFPFRQEWNVADYVHHLRERLQWAYEIARGHIDKDVARRKLYYDRKYHCMEIIPGDIVLVRQKVFGSDHKIADWWELPVYKVLEKHGDGPVFTVQRIGPGNDETIRNLHQNMLYPFISLMGDEGATEPAVEVTDPAVSAVQQDLRMASLIRANTFMDTYFDPDW